MTNTTSSTRTTANSKIYPSRDVSFDDRKVKFWNAILRRKFIGTIPAYG
jgi:hypothetical protein